MAIRVIRGDATLLSGQSCQQSCTTARNGRVTCTTTCSTLQFLSPESFPIPSRGSPDVVDNLFLGSGPLGTTTFHFNPYVIGVHRLSSAISIGHPQAGWSILSDGALQ
jgi:hypothetical protein